MVDVDVDACARARVCFCAFVSAFVVFGFMLLFEFASAFMFVATSSEQMSESFH